MSGKRGAFIAFEGIDGSGKGTQISLLKKRLEAEGFATKDTTITDMSGGDIKIVLKEAR